MLSLPTTEDAAVLRGEKTGENKGVPRCPNRGITPPEGTPKSRGREGWRPEVTLLFTPKEKGSLIVYGKREKGLVASGTNEIDLVKSRRTFPTSLVTSFKKKPERETPTM